MADQQPPVAQPQGESAENLHTDPVTGEKISKSELKRRQKQREKDEKKKEKEAAMPARPKKENKDAAEELNPNVCNQAWCTAIVLSNTIQQYFEIRSNKINALRTSKQPNPYPHKFHVNYKLPDYVRDYSHLKKGDTEPEKEIRMGLRVITQRSASSSLHFYVCKYGISQS
jgi:lysyl-tRNA synthetase, class II